MNFFDEDYMHLPGDNRQYYFNVLVTCIAVSPQYAHELLPQGIVEQWDISNITDARPRAYFVYPCLLDNDTDFEVTKYPHCVVEVGPADVCWWEMLDFDTEDPWEITASDFDDWDDEDDDEEDF